MVAVAVVHDEAGADGSQLHVYYNSQNKNLGLQFRNERTKKESTVNSLSSDDDAHPGIIVTQSHLASTRMNNMELIFGVTEQKGFTVNSDSHAADCKCPPPGKTDVDISLVSPVYTVVGSTDSIYYKIAACSSDDNTWAYYLKINNGELRIHESTIGEGNDEVFTSTNTIHSDSALASYYDAKNGKRYIIYQAKASNKLRELRVSGGGGGNDSEIQNAGGRAGTTLAVAVTDTTVYLYYIDSNGMVNRVTKPLGGGDWGSGSIVSDAVSSIGSDSQLTVSTADLTKQKYNHIFYKADKQATKIGFVHVMDAQ